MQLDHGPIPPCYTSTHPQASGFTKEVAQCVTSTQAPAGRRLQISGTDVVQGILLYPFLPLAAAYMVYDL